MGDAAVSVTKISRRKVMSVATDGDFGPDMNRYQIYRGLSPETSNRLEIKIQCLEEELQAERQAKQAAQQHCTYLTEEMQIQNDHYDGLEGRVSSHTEALRARDQENQRLRQECDALLERSEVTEAHLKKKHQEVVNELNEQVEHLTKQRNRSDADKKNFLVEISELNANMERLQAAKAHVESKLESCENDLRRLNNDNDDKTRQLQDFGNWKLKLLHDNGELQSKVKALESSVDGYSRERQKYMRDVETLKASLEEAEAGKPHLISTAASLQVALDEAKMSLEEEQQRMHFLQTQLQKLQNDNNNLKNKYDKDMAASNEENETIRKRYLSKIAEQEDSLNSLIKKTSKMEKDHSKVVIEIRDVIDELELSKANAADLSKKLKHSESLSSEQRYQVDQLSANLHTSEANVQKLQAEVARLKSLLTEKEDKFQELGRELKAAHDKCRECKQEGDEVRHQVHSLLDVKANLERELAKVPAIVSELNRKLSESQRSLEVAASEAKQQKEEFAAELRSKDEEINGLKRTNQKLTEEYHHRLADAESHHRNEISRTKKLLESEILQITTNHDSAVKSSAELVRANKSLAARVKELEGQMMTDKNAMDDLRNQLSSSERRRMTTQSELDQLASKLDHAEHVRKMAELAMHELDQKVSELHVVVTSAGNDSRRHESEANALRVIVEEANVARRDAEERSERLRLELDGTLGALNLQMELNQEKDSNLKALEKEVKEARASLEEVEQKLTRDGKKLLAKVQTRCKALEVDLDAEQKKYREMVAENRKLQRSLQEVIGSKENDAREKAELSSQLESAVANLARMKKHLAEAEDVITIVTNKYRRLQHQLQEASDQQQQQEMTALVIAERAAGSLTGVHHHHHGLSLPVANAVANAVATRVSIARTVASSTSLSNRI